MTTRPSAEGSARRDTAQGLRPLHRPIQGRRPDERHRRVTPLELFFDLCFVVAVAQAADNLHHEVSEGHLAHAVTSYLMVFVAVWWAWMNFTWFASAYDTDDDVFRLTTLVQITGALILAAGVPAAFTDNDYTTTTVGYVMMRLGGITHWIRAARGDPAHRATAATFAVGVTLLQLGWLLRLLLPAGWVIPSVLLLFAAELLVPVIAERHGMTPWHPRHIVERYELFTLIVLGESVLATAVAIQAGVDAGDEGLWPLAAAGALTAYAVWWLQFDRPIDVSSRPSLAFTWGYGHYLIFASIAAIGAGLAVAIDRQRQVGHADARTAGYAVALPVATYLTAFWVLRVLPRQRGLIVLAFPVTAIGMLVVPLGPAPVYLVAVLMVVLVALTVLDRWWRLREDHDGGR
ncbi:low temperature requirement protein A [Micromonospora sp. BQ11]|uniref:low temperature requirement protein A n=1 Tax=Micromonospora sp. BQ11 TaxID=3452212 RepID=UPI003F8BEC5E